MVLFLDNVKEVFSSNSQLPLFSSKGNLMLNKSNDNSLIKDKKLGGLEVNNSKKNSSFFPYKLEKKTKVYFVVNKYNELVQASSRLYSFNSQKLKPIYFCFLSKSDAVDFLYKIAMSDPIAFKKTGLGINSFSLEKFKQVSNKSKNMSDMVLINNLSEVEALYSNSLKNYKNISISNKNDIVGKKTINNILCYRICEPSLSEQLFLTLEDVQDKWNEFSNDHKKQKNCQIRIEFLSLEEIKKI